MTAIATDDTRFMRMALMMGRRGLGRVAPNPSVGCVLVKNGRVIGRGTTAPGGRPHAEVEAITSAKARFGPAVTKGATAYVTLEPCSFHGKSAPCVDALIKAGIARVVCAIEDPNPKVSGSGFTQLRNAGIEVQTGILESDARASHAGFFQKITNNRPYVMLKLGTSLDGKIATHSGKSQWITGPQARARAHFMRARFDAIMVGIGTALADDPELTCRLPGLEDRSPIRVVVDSHMRLPLTAGLVKSARDVPTILLTRDKSDKARRKAFVDAGVDVLTIPTAEGEEGVALSSALTALAEKGVTRLMVEGGSQIAAGLFKAGCVDTIAWFRAGGVIGGDGMAGIAGIGVDAPTNMPRYQLSRQEILGQDTLDIWVKQA